MLFLLSGFLDVPQCDFIHIYSASDWSNFLDLWMCNFQQIYEMFSHYFFKYFPQCCLLWNSNYRYIKMSHIVPYTTNILFQHFSLYSSLWILSVLQLHCFQPSLPTPANSYVQVQPPSREKGLELGSWPSKRTQMPGFQSWFVFPKAP